MKRERWRTVFFLVVLLFFTLFVRIIFMQPNARFIEFRGDYYQKALIGSLGVYKLQEFSIDELYTKFLSVCMLFFGNSKVAGVYLNIILQVLTIVCIYLAMEFVSLNSIRFSPFSSSPNTVCKCQAIASPSLSGSVAR